jgi:hemerythrin-like metal-binding protein
MTKFLEWCDLFRIGIPTIDKQHQSLIDIINDFHSQMNQGVRGKLIFETLNRLISYAQNHFSSEEDLLEKFGYPDGLLSDHKKKHEQLVQDIFSLNEDLENSRLSSMEEIEKFLLNWLVLHILIEDKKFKDQLPGVDLTIRGLSQ